MGIRYYAYPIAADHIESARNDPWPHLSSDPLADAWQLHAEGEPVPPKPTVLYLDKAWSYLQRLLPPERVAHQLVTGDVTYVDGGQYEAFVQVLDPQQVAAIADDLGTVTRGDVESWHCADRFVRDDDLDYVADYLADAQTFVADMATLKLGLITVIR